MNTAKRTFLNANIFIPLIYPGLNLIFILSGGRIMLDDTWGFSLVLIFPLALFVSLSLWNLWRFKTNEPIPSRWLLIAGLSQLAFLGLMFIGIIFLLMISSGV